MKIIDNKNIDMTDEEWIYYLELVKSITDVRTNGALYFKNLFTTDNRGYIIMIMPKNEIPWLILFFIQNLMINQRLKEFDDCSKKIKELEKIINVGK